MSHHDSGPAIAVVSIHSEVTENNTKESLEELIFKTTSAALAQAGLSHSTLDGVVYSGQDEVDGRVISCMTSAGPAAGVDRDVTMIASTAEHALIYAWMRLRSGQGKNVLVVGWSKPSESVSPDHAELVSAEPYFLRPLGMNDTIAAALQASVWGYDPTGDGAETPVVAWPLTRDDLPARADAVHAAVLMAEDGLDGRTPLAWIRGAGWAIDRYELGQRDLSQQAALTDAVAFLSEHTQAPLPDAWQAVEVAAGSEVAVERSRSTLGLAEGATLNATGTLREVPEPAHVAGLSRMLHAARAVEAKKATTAAGVALNGFAGQAASIVVFSSEKG